MRLEVTISESHSQGFGIHVGTMDKWLHQARTAVGEQPGMTSSENTGLKKQRNRLLERENEVLRRAATHLSHANLPAIGSTRS